MESSATVPLTKPRFPWKFWLLLLVPVVLILFSHPTKSMLTWEPYRTLRWYWGAGDFKTLLNRINFLAILGLLVQAILLTARWVLTMKASPSSQDSETDSVGETATPLPKFLPWQFWLWQCVPMTFLILVMPPGNTLNWWFHEPAIAWIGQQPWASLLVGLIFTTWFSQGVLLAFWLVWGSGHWPYRFCKVMGLAATTTLLPAIWFGRHFHIFSPGLTPWSEVLNPFELSKFFLWAVGVSFLPAFFCGRNTVPDEIPPSTSSCTSFVAGPVAILTEGFVDPHVGFLACTLLIWLVISCQRRIHFRFRHREFKDG